jgi:hypothetical protein
MIQEPESDSLYEKLIYDNQDKFYQLRLVVNEFRGKQYVHIRKYFMTYEGDYQASREGISMEASINNIFSLLDGLMEICSKEEQRQLIEEYFGIREYALKRHD